MVLRVLRKKADKRGNNRTTNELQSGVAVHAWDLRGRRIAAVSLRSAWATESLSHPSYSAKE